ncbi:MAG TPA: hypothetical protein VHX86_02580 [Tepidisphaeraceae bacterium]|jgi:hypothetical protein|nr:hypothetical protein [Tepidisphaeraceae bacterium]
MNNESTLPKPFVFVLMPIEEAFSDIYKFGIKGAAEDVGAYAERVDEQLFTEGILDRIFTQINKADVVVADMTGRNPNVFYEVGYAHALGKTVLLLTQSVDDIPFDLKHRPHIVYGGKIDVLKTELGKRLRWAIEYSTRNRSPVRLERLALFVSGVEAINPLSRADAPVIIGEARSRQFSVPVQLRNDSAETLSPITHVYLFLTEVGSLIPTERPTWMTTTETVSGIFPTFGSSAQTYQVSVEPLPLEPMPAAIANTAGEFAVQFRLPVTFPSVPPGALEVTNLHLMFRDGAASASDDLFRLRLFSPYGFHEFDFRLRISVQEGTATSNGA